MLGVLQRWHLPSCRAGCAIKACLDLTQLQQFWQEIGLSHKSYKNSRNLILKPIILKSQEDFLKKARDAMSTIPLSSQAVLLFASLKAPCAPNGNLLPKLLKRNSFVKS